MNDIKKGFNRKWALVLPSFVSSAMVIILLIFVTLIVFFHSIFNEYDAMYIFLPISKSILIGNGLNTDFFGGSDLSIRYPPFNQAINAWILTYFDYSYLRIFPVYFIILSSISVYYLTKKIVNDKFLSAISTAIYLILPASLVIFSRFSLQQDIPFLTFLTYSAIAFYNLINSAKIKKFDFMMFIISLSLLPLVREIGLIIAWSVLFSAFAIKFTRNRNYIKILLLFIAFSPLYALTVYDIAANGITVLLSLRLSILIVGNICMFVISTRYKASLRFSNLRNYLPFFLILSIPMLFIASNLILMKGPYPTLMFSKEFSDSISEYRDVFGIAGKLHQSLLESLVQLPRVDLLFISTALGSTFIFFKIIGFTNFIRKTVVKDKKYVFILSYYVILLIVWSYLLNSAYTEAYIRHIGYFIPFMCIIITLGFRKPLLIGKLYILFLVLIATYHIIHYQVAFSYVNGIFNAVWIDPLRSEFITLDSFALGATLTVGYFLISYFEKRILRKGNRYIKYTIYLGFILFILLYVYTLFSFNLGISLNDIFKGDTMDGPLPYLWENNVVEIINYLEYADKGNILSIRTPVIPFLTSRTNYDFFNPHTFGNIILPLLHSQNVSSLEKNLVKNNIKYIILPAEGNPQFDVLKNIEKKYKFVDLLSNNTNFTKINLGNYTILKYNINDPRPIDLFGDNFEWKPVYVEIVKSNSSLLMLLETEGNDSTFGRVYEDTYLASGRVPPLMYLNYSAYNLEGASSFYFEVRDSMNNQVLFTQKLENSYGEAADKFIILPESIFDRDIQMRFYIITEEAGRHYLLLDKAILLKP